MDQKRRKESLIVKTGLAIALLGGVSISGHPVFAHAESSQQISQEKQKVDDKVKQIQENMKMAESKINDMKKNFDETRQKITDMDKQITETQQRIDSRQQILDSRLVAYQQNQGLSNPYLEVIFNSDSFGDFVNRVFAVSTIMDADQDLISKQKADQKLQLQQKDDLLAKKDDLQKQFQTLQEEYSKMETQKAEQEALSLQLGNKLDDAKKEEAAKQEEAAKKEEERAKRLAALQKQTFKQTSKAPIQFNEDSSATKKSSQIIKEASKYLGYQYTWGGSNPDTSFDCSGLTQWSFKQNGINLPRTAAQQYLATKRVSASDIKPGDLVFFSYGSGIAHVGIYIGDGKMIDAQNNGVKVDNLGGYWSQYIAGYGRVDGVN